MVARQHGILGSPGRRKSLTFLAETEKARRWTAPKTARVALILMNWLCLGKGRDGDRDEKGGIGGWRAKKRCRGNEMMKKVKKFRKAEVGFRSTAFEKKAAETEWSVASQRRSKKLR